MNIAIQLLLTTLVGANPASTEVSDLCDVVDRATGSPTICQPHEIGAPVFDGEVCCAGDSCYSASGGGCLSGEVLYYCELGEQGVTGEVTCYFEVPNYCDVHPCDLHVTPGGSEDFICCYDEGCWHYEVDDNYCPSDNLFFCLDGVTTADGTVECFDVL